MLFFNLISIVFSFYFNKNEKKINLHYHTSCVINIDLFKFIFDASDFVVVENIYFHQYGCS